MTDWFAEHAPSAAPPPAQAGDWFGQHQPKPDFQSTNATDASGQAEVDPNTLGTLFSHVGGQLNPIKIIQSVAHLLPIGEMFGGTVPAQSGPRDAIGMPASAYPVMKFIKGWMGQNGELANKTADAYKRGDYLTAARHFVDYAVNGVPGVGANLDTSADEMQQGKYAAGIGDALGLGVALFGPQAMSEALAGRKITTKPPMANTNAKEAAAVDFGKQNGIPIDAATATGNSFVRGAQNIADRSIGGSVIGGRARSAQSAALTATSDRLATDAFPRSVTPEGAGNAVADALATKQAAHEAYANTAYERLRAIEQNPINGEYVSVDVSPQAKARMQATLGTIPTPAELQELRRIREEMHAVPYQPGQMHSEIHGEETRSTYMPRQAGARVFHDIGQATGATVDRGEMQASIERALETGNFTNVSKGALQVAKRRLAGEGGYGVSRPILPEGAGAQQQGMLLPVSLASFKAQIRPFYDQLMREKDIAPLMGAKGRALVALDRLMRAPDHAPVSVVDGALGDLKALDRATTGPGQGVIKQAVKYLDGAVQAAVAKAGPEAVRALRDGRAATVAKYQTADVLDLLKNEPVQAYRQMTAPKDAGIDLLRTVQREVPQAMSSVARAYLDDLFQTATADGKFGRADKLWADWQKLGSETKRALFPRAGQVEGLDRFFLLAKKIGENPNPSGSGFTGLQGAEMATFVYNPLAALSTEIGLSSLSALLRSPKAVQILTRGMSLSIGKAPAASQAAVAAELVKLAQAEGLPLATGAADRNAPPPGPAR